MGMDKRVIVGAVCVIATVCVIAVAVFPVIFHEETAEEKKLHHLREEMYDGKIWNIYSHPEGDPFHIYANYGHDVRNVWIDEETMRWEAYAGDMWEKYEVAAHNITKIKYMDGTIVMWEDYPTA